MMVAEKAVGGTEIRAVLFDFGGVISSSPFEAFARFEAERQLPPDFIRTVNATNSDSNAWAQLERSDIGIDTFVSLWSAEAVVLGHEVDAREVLARLAGAIRPEMVAAIRTCRDAGFKTACLTNNFGSVDSVERRVHGGRQQSSQLSDVVERVDVEDGLLDGGLAFGRDGAVGQLGVLVTDLRVRKVPVAGTARVYDLGGVSAPVVEGQAHLGCEPLVDREVVVGLFVVGDRSVDQVPDVIAVDPVL
jgi:hypothetical protein